jgi:hypothetical protein
MSVSAASTNATSIAERPRRTDTPTMVRCVRTADGDGAGLQDTAEEEDNVGGVSGVEMEVDVVRTDTEERGHG